MDLAKELGVQSVVVQPNEQEDRRSRNTVASILAAGGEEDHGLELLLSLDTRSGSPTYLVGSRVSHRFGIEALRRGAADYFSLPEDVDLLRRTLAARVEAAREASQEVSPAADLAFSSIIGDSSALHATLDKAKRVLFHGDVTILIGGETGTGKELLARAIHDGGPRASGPFVAINCAAIPAALLESELFGHEKGAFTDAHHTKVGLFEEAHGGSLFLDEIGHLPIELQGKLLRALEERQIRRVGGLDVRDIDVRIIAATHIDLSQAAELGEFRQDLFYRLNVVSLYLPPLRERGSDLELLANRFVNSLATRYGLPVPGLSSAVLTALRLHSWPGNVRELHHAIERALLLSAPGSLDPAELVPDTRPGPGTSSEPIPFPATLQQINAVAAQQMVNACDGNKSEAARQLGVSRARLQRLLDHHDALGHRE
jgi:two-component system response regulator HydG